MTNQHEQKPQYWKSPVERDGQSDVPPPPGVSRRNFLEAAGFTLSLAAVGGCGRAPVQHARPAPVLREGMRPGRMRYYAGTCSGCAAGCGLLAGVRDGRPLKMEGMPEHPLSRGGLCAVGQALTMGLYDSHRLTGPLQNGQPSTWDDVDARISASLEEIAKSGGAVRVLTSTNTSPTLQSAIDRFLKQFADARQVIFDAQSASAMLDAHQQTHGRRVLPHYRLDRAKVIVAFEADFLGNWFSPVEFTAAWRSGRVLPDQPAKHEHAPGDLHPESIAHVDPGTSKPASEPKHEQPTPGGPVEMSYHVQFESRMTLTGSNADRRFKVRPQEMGLVLSHLAQRIAKHAGHGGTDERLASSVVSDDELDRLADRLWEHRGGSLILCGSQEVATQLVVNYVNHLLGNYGETIDLQRPSRQRQSDDRALEQLVAELKEGKVAALFVAEVDPIHDLPEGAELAAAIGKLPLSVSLSDRLDDTAAVAQYVCPVPHSLESWLDAEPIAGLVSLIQPTLPPLGNTRSALESFSAWSGTPSPALDLLQAHWKEHFLPRQQREQSFQRFWDQTVRNGFVELDVPESPTTFNTEAVRLITGVSETNGLTLVLYSKVAIPESRHAHNPWLQELPDPVTKVTWDNYASVSPKLAAELQLVENDVVSITVGEGESIELPVFIQPGQHDGVVAVALGYGVRGTERFANVGPHWIQSKTTVGENGLVGVNAAPLAKLVDGALHSVRGGVQLKKTGRRHPLASTQMHDNIDVPPELLPPGSGRRDIVQETSLDAYREDPSAGAPEAHHSAGQLWPEDHPADGHRWGMVVDLNACTGCSACLIACQSENNVPVVGRDEVGRHREMHWIRVDRYYAGSEDDPEVVHQPMMCQHCGNAPCETVCPVLATVHSSEGLNQQVYNRCVGTRYCANNCPYKVRRFNWFDYAHDDTLQNLILNPDITVRMRGIMEKCSLCVQRIQEGKIEARRQGHPVSDGMIQTACQQSCPAGAIVFGDLNDPASRAATAMHDARRYRVLEELNVQPSVGYLRLVRNSSKENDGV